MTTVWIILAGCLAAEGARALVYRLFGYRLTVKVLALAYTELRILDWNWTIGRAHWNEYDDASDLRHLPRILRDHGFSVEPLFFRIQSKRTAVIRDGEGRVYQDAEQRERVHEHQRHLHGRVLGDYTPNDYDAMVGKWTPKLIPRKPAA